MPLKFNCLARNSAGILIIAVQDNTRIIFKPDFAKLHAKLVWKRIKQMDQSLYVYTAIATHRRFLSKRNRKTCTDRMAGTPIVVCGGLKLDKPVKQIYRAVVGQLEPDAEIRPKLAELVVFPYISVAGSLVKIPFIRHE